MRPIPIIPSEINRLIDNCSYGIVFDCKIGATGFYRKIIGGSILDIKFDVERSGDNTESLLNRLTTLDFDIFDYCNELKELHKAGGIDRLDYHNLLDKLLDVCVTCQDLAFAVQLVKNN